MNIRLFVAIALPEDVNDQLELLAMGLPGARWSPPHQRHLTVRFIGDVDGLDYQDIVEALHRVHAQPFEITLRGVGHFPPRGAPRTLWAGVSESPELLALHRRVDRVLVETKREPERRKYVPHVTLARLNGTPSSRVGSFLSAHGLYRSEPFEVRGFALYSSRLFQHGPEYSLEAEYSFGSGSSALPESR